MNSLRAKIVATTVCASVLILEMQSGITDVRASIVGVDECMLQNIFVHPDRPTLQDLAILNSPIQRDLPGLQGDYPFSCCVGMDIHTQSVEPITIESALNLKVGFLKLLNRQPGPKPVSVPILDSSGAERAIPITPVPIE